MQFLKTLFWVVLAVVAVIFGIRNWIPVTIALWGGMEADTKLPVLLLAAFLLGFLPMFVIYKATRWQLRRKLDASQKALDDARNAMATTIPDPAVSYLEDPAPHSSLL